MGNQEGLTSSSPMDEMFLRRIMVRIGRDRIGYHRLSKFVDRLMENDPQRRPLLPEGLRFFFSLLHYG